MTKAVSVKKDAFDRFKSLDKQDINTIACAGMGVGMGVCAYYMGRITALYGRTITGITPKLPKFGSFNPAQAFPVLGVIQSVHNALDYLRSKHKTKKDLYDLWKTQLDSAADRLNKATDQTRAAAQQMYDNTKAQLKILEDALVDFFELQQGLFIGQAILAGFMTMWLGNNPDVVKQMIGSAEKVAVRGIDELSEIIDKSGEAVADSAKALLPDLWGLGW